MDARPRQRYHAGAMFVLVVGDANADLCARLARFPREGDDSPLAGLDWQSGGSALNVATALARLGGRARLAARVGVDPAAEVALDAPRRAGVALELVQRDPSLATGLCFAAVSPGGERTFFSYRGANVALAGVDAPAAFRDAAWLHLGAHALIEGPQRATALALIDEAERRALGVSVDLCLPLVRGAPAEARAIVARAAVAFANERESEAAEAAGVALGAARVLVEKLGARGARVCRSGQGVGVPAFAVEARDTTACGDAFVAGFLLATVRGALPEHAAVVGNAAGALTATRPGAAPALPSRDEVRGLLVERGASEASLL
ncbi:MAG TPA: carbohydrate kinase family protein [Polyangiaceae bacterium]|nr:carbohydrate kinase family protein [Polyangiaceae bacterium]